MHKGVLLLGGVEIETRERANGEKASELEFKFRPVICDMEKNVAKNTKQKAQRTSKTKWKDSAQVAGKTS